MVIIILLIYNDFDSKVECIIDFWRLSNLEISVEDYLKIIFHNYKVPIRKDFAKFGWDFV